MPTTIVRIEQLAAWLDANGIGTGVIHDVREIGGGTQNLMLLFRRGDDAYVLRSPPAHATVNAEKTIARESAVLAALSGSDVPHPEFLGSCVDPDVVGRPFYLMHHVEGFNAQTEMPERHRSNKAVRRAMGFSLVDGALAIAGFDYESTGLAKLGKLDRFIERQVPRWQSQFESYSKYAKWDGAGDFQAFERISRWLVEHRPDSFKAGLMHGDYHIGNVMYRRDSARLAAIVDWELATVGDPLIDLGWLMATWPDEGGPRPGDVGPMIWEDFPSRAELVAHYVARSERDTSSVSWYAVLACFKMGILLEGTYARACDGLVPKETGARLHQSAIALFRRGESWLQ